MCGRYGFTDPSKFRDRYDVDDENIDLKPNYNIAPSQTLPVITKNGAKHIELMRWGLIPFWAKDIGIGTKIMNARAEGIAEKPSFRKPFRSQRCLVPANYFFEWHKTKEGNIPFLVKFKDEEIFSFAGLYDIVKDAEGRDLKSYTIITTEPNRLMQTIHNRMPVILQKEDEERWLDLKSTEDELKNMLKPFSDKEMITHQISSAVNNPENNSASITFPV